MDAVRATFSGAFYELAVARWQDCHTTFPTRLVSPLAARQGSTYRRIGCQACGLPALSPQSELTLSAVATTCTCVAQRHDTAHRARRARSSNVNGGIYEACRLRLLSVLQTWHWAMLIPNSIGA